MTLTKYQRGDLMEGWNDCPPIMLQKNSSSTKVASINSSVETITPVTASDIEITEVIENLSSLDSVLNPNLLGQIKQKLLTAAESMSADNQKFVYAIFSQIKEGVDTKTLKNQVVEYMMLNDGVSPWCSPLKKLLDGVSQ